MGFPAFLYDDGYITLRSAEVLWTGHDPQFQGATTLHGITSPFHVLLVALLLRVLPPEWALLASCLLGTAAYATGLTALGRVEGLSPTLTTLLVVTGLGTGVSLQHQINGLETSWAMAAVCWSLVLARTERWQALSALCGVLPFIRPEFAIWSAVVLTWSAVRHPGRAGLSVLIAAMTAAPWAWWLWSATGNVVPTSLAAKRDWFAESCWPWSRRMSVVGGGLALWSVFSLGAIVGFAGLVRTGLGRLAVGSMVAIVAAWSMAVPSLLYSYQRHRYYATFLVFLMFGLCHLPRRHRRPVIVFGAIAAVATSIVSVRLEPGMIAGMQDARRGVIAELQLLEAQRVLLHDPGYLGWVEAGPTLIDMVGLKSPEAAALHASMTGPSCGASRPEAIAELARRTQPDTLVVWEPWDDIYGVSAALRDTGWSLTGPARVGDAAPILIYGVRAPEGAMPRAQ